MPYWTRHDYEVRAYEDRIAFLQAVCRIAANRLENGGTFPIKGETWELLDFAAGPRQTKGAVLGSASAGSAVNQDVIPSGSVPLPDAHQNGTDAAQENT